MADVPINQIICGAAEEVLPTLPPESINCCISSPPYWALRDYGVEGQLGLEPTFEEYIDRLCNIYDEVKRVLRKDGTCWVNLGDTYGGSGMGVSYAGHCRGPNAILGQNTLNSMPAVGHARGKYDKCLLLIPQRFAIEMVNRGWILRNNIIWHKPNPMPSSAKDRFTVDFEYVFFFVKQKKYFFEPIYEPYLTESNAERPRMGQGDRTKYKQKRCGWLKSGRGNSEQTSMQNDGPQQPNPLGRNKRTVWTIPTEAFAEAHFATFPRALVEPMILAGCPEFVCKKCGLGRRKVYETEYEKIGSGTVGGRGRFGVNDNSGFTGKPTMARLNHFKGLTDCGCKAGWRPGICLDPFRRGINYLCRSRAA